MRPLVASRREVATLVRSRQLLLLTQAVFFGALAICLIIDDGRTARIDGISYYGVYHRTIFVLATGYLVSAAGLFRTAQYFTETDAPLLLR